MRLNRFPILVMWGSVIGLAILLSVLTGCTDVFQNPAGENSASSTGRSLLPTGMAVGEVGDLSDWRYWMSRVPTKGELEAAIVNHMENLIDREFFFIPREEKPSLEIIQSYREAWERQLREKLAIAPEPLLAHFVYFNMVDAYVKKQIDYADLKLKYSKGEISHEGIQELYQKAFDKLGIDTEAILKAGFDKSWMKEQEMGVGTKSGAHNAELNQNRMGDVMYRAPGGGGSSSWPGFGHAAIWRLTGDPDPDEPLTPVAMSSWGSNPDPDPNERLHERKGVGYDYRRCWSQSNTYGLRVIDYQGSDASDGEASDAKDYAEPHRGDPYNLCKGLCILPTDWFNKYVTNKFYCSQLPWQSWCWGVTPRDKYDIDSGDYWQSWVVTPEELYLDNNTRCMYNF